MPETKRLLVDLHALKSAREYDYAKPGSEITHISIGMGEYDTQWHYEFTGRSWTAIIPLDQLWEWADAQGFITEEVREVWR